SSSSRRTFYDPLNPRMLSEQEISTMSSAECNAACLQIDQIIVSVLQNIDADFGRCHRTVADKILPEIEKQGLSSQKIWEGLKFWQGFFEASANVKLSDNRNDESAGGTSSSFPSNLHDHQSQPTERGPEELGIGTSKLTTATRFGDEPNKSTAQSQLSIPPENSGQSGSTTSLRRPPHWHDLSMDSPDTTLQMLPTQIISPIKPSSSNDSVVSGISLSLCAPSADDEAEPTPRADTRSQTAVATRAPILLHKALMRDMMSEKHKRRTISTPAKPSSSQPVASITFPQEVIDPSWNGITDLQKTTLDSFVSPAKQLRRPYVDYTDKASSKDDTEESLRAGISPPQTINFSVPRSKLARTPSKEAARLITRDVLETARFRAGYENPTDLEDSPPLEPPSVLREWKTRGYDQLLRPKDEVEDERKVDGGIGTKRQPSLDDRSKVPCPSGPLQEVSRSLIDLRDNETSSSNFEDSFDNTQRALNPFKQGPQDESGDSHRREHLFSRSNHGLSNQPSHGERSEESRGGSFAAFRSRKEDKRLSRASGPSNSLFSPESPDVLQQRSDRDRGRNFVPMKPDEMDTYFGGNLLEAECFEPSPLQGKRVKYSDPKPN
ncbi:DASH complex subunit Ask1-domain-containing protein, partial [Phakopsora pachyrhizi]